jgi:hypothetical protein
MSMTTAAEVANSTGMMTADLSDPSKPRAHPMKTDPRMIECRM